MAEPLNRDIADRLDEVGRVLRDQNADQFRVNAYHGAATSIRHWPRPVSELFRERGLPGLEECPVLAPASPAPSATSSPAGGFPCSIACEARCPR